MKKVFIAKKGLWHNPKNWWPEGAPAPKDSRKIPSGAHVIFDKPIDGASIVVGKNCKIEYKGPLEYNIPFPKDYDTTKLNFPVKGVMHGQMHLVTSSKCVIKCPIPK